MKEEITFEQLSLNDTMLHVVEKMYFKKPTAIQQEAIPHILSGKSIIGQSQTGSGKTHAYLLPLLNEIDETKNDIQVVITAPTRELAMQIFEEIKHIAEIANKQERWKTRLIIGGTDRERMIKQLKNPPHIIVGTPGRILDMVNEGAMSIYSANSFVIDEADLMLDLKFIEPIDELLVRSKKDIQLLVFSATIPQPLAHFMNKYLSRPIHIKIDGSNAPETLTHRLIDIKHQEITSKIMEITKVIQPYVAIIFANSKEMVDEISSVLLKEGIKVGVLHGGLTNRERSRAVKDILDLKYQYIVATDLASRGIDIKGASHVINAELPKEIEFYIHRVGRTARAGLEGKAISFYKEEDIPFIQKLEERGITFIYSDVKDGEFVEVNRYNKRALRKNISTKLDQEAWKYVKKPKKIKPGYKKKMKKEQEKIKRRLQKRNRNR